MPQGRYQVRRDAQGFPHRVGLSPSAVLLCSVHSSKAALSHLPLPQQLLSPVPVVFGPEAVGLARSKSDLVRPVVDSLELAINPAKTDALLDSLAALPGSGGPMP